MSAVILFLASILAFYASQFFLSYLAFCGCLLFAVVTLFLEREYEL